MTLFRCCLVAIIIIIIRFVLSGLSFSLLDSIQNKISARQPFKIETDSCAFGGKWKVVCRSMFHQRTDIMISNDLAERRSI